MKVLGRQGIRCYIISLTTIRFTCKAFNGQCQTQRRLRNSSYSTPALQNRVLQDEDISYPAKTITLYAKMNIKIAAL